MKVHYHTIYLEDDTPVILGYTATPYIPARTYGPPEDCYPAEGGEIEIVSLEIEKDGRFIPIDIPDEELEPLYNELYDLPVDDDYPDSDGWYDEKRDEGLTR